MSRGGALTAGLPENDSAPTGAVAEATEKGKCIRPCAPLAAKIARCRSSQEAVGPCTARTASVPPGGSDKWGAADV